MKTRACQEEDRFVSATEIASMFFCEQKIVLDAKHGETVTPEQAKARARGTRIHKEVDRVARKEHNRKSSGDGRSDYCFVATHVYGYHDPRTDELRRFRDRVMMRHPVGAFVVRMYYRWSPAVVRWMEGRSVATAASRVAIDVIRSTVSPWTGEGYGRKEPPR